MQTFILALHIILALAITALVLLQRSGGGLGSLAGGQSANSFLTGRQAGSLLTKLTSYFFVGFIATSLTLVIMAKKTQVAEEVPLIPAQQEQQ